MKPVLIWSLEPGEPVVKPAHLLLGVFLLFKGFCFIRVVVVRLQ